MVLGLRKAPSKADGRHCMIKTTGTALSTQDQKPGYRDGICSWLLLKKVKVLVAQSSPTLCDPTDGSPPRFSAHATFQTRTLEWVAISFSRGSSQARDRTWVSYTAGRRFTISDTREAWYHGKEIACQCMRSKRCRFELWVRKIPSRRKWQPLQ